VEPVFFHRWIHGASLGQENAKGPDRKTEATSSTRTPYVCLDRADNVIEGGPGSARRFAGEHFAPHDTSRHVTPEVVLRVPRRSVCERGAFPSCGGIVQLQNLADQVAGVLGTGRIGVILLGQPVQRVVHVLNRVAVVGRPRVGVLTIRGVRTAGPDWREQRSARKTQTARETPALQAKSAPFAKGTKDAAPENAKNKSRSLTPIRKQRGWVRDDNV
jgi:hypothetical protein